MKNLVALFTVFYSGAECFLKDFLSSLKEQSYKEFDLIIVNDGFEVGEFENLLFNLSSTCGVIRRLFMFLIM